MNRLLQEIEARLAEMTAANRDEVVQGIRSIIVGMLRMRDAGLRVGKFATGKAAGQLMIWMASETLPEIIDHLKEMAAATGPHVDALFHTV